MPALLDTCAWLWMAADEKRLSKNAKAAIKKCQKEEALFVSVISCWEVAKLVEKGEISLSFPVRDWIHSAIRIKGITLQEITPEICVHSTELPGKFQGDPADQIIIATARILRLPLITADKKIREYTQVKTVW